MNLIDDKIAIQWYLIPAIAILILFSICVLSFVEEGPKLPETLDHSRLQRVSDEIRPRPWVNTE